MSKGEGGKNTAVNYAKCFSIMLSIARDVRIITMHLMLDMCDYTLLIFKN